jgi:hypothetical protein
MGCSTLFEFVDDRSCRRSRNTDPRALRGF